ncbi:GreA/GreB family elongation factor [Mycobacterium ostraviense]|uniref:Transcription elongation factor GreAB n=1 Tax=Mycobacterium ostraviense TaxID=2738409 RepID=A0A163UV76_9MYCO|nr:GreA/GreB family elongation factor [Mycobacterium ostraviense]KZS56677.1 transcription elongation factor GreAB [Mycobacterium ostraviense]UGT94131.1 GreA/GreB family elongation factor [Mycobacterium ostraviense]
METKKRPGGQRDWISSQAYERLQRKLADLRGLSAREPADSDFDDNGPDAQRAWQTRIRQIHDLLVRADVGDDPPDYGVAEPGMVLTVRYHDTGDTETFLLGARGVEHCGVEVYSPRSPLGAAVTGARPGEQRSFTLPGGATLTVTLLSAEPYGVHLAGAT